VILENKKSGSQSVSDDYLVAAVFYGFLVKERLFFFVGDYHLSQRGIRLRDDLFVFPYSEEPAIAEQRVVPETCQFLPLFFQSFESQR